ncbi:MAG TPA: serine/threonine-protein kinase [Urbifossiella sp.]|nr:serine/threonine-protein kinase [Urbifossiella sp.]
MTFFPKVRSTTPGAFPLGAGAEPAPGYRLTRVRGRGGFAEVWEAASPNGPIALKFMLSSNATTTSRELRSVQSFQSMDHPYLVKTHAVFTVAGYIVTAMELAEATLLDLMFLYHDELRQPIPAAQLGLYLWQVGQALDFLNARRHVRDGRKVGFQHGDIKPNNVLLFGDVAKLTDYGVATATNGPTTPCPRHGTRDYAAPEVLQGYQTDSSDQFSLAVTYHVLRSGCFPFPPAPPGDLPKTYGRPAPDLSAVPPAEQAILLRALSPVPQARYPNCEALTQALLKALGYKVLVEAGRPATVVPEDETLPDTVRSGAKSRPGLTRQGPSRPG